MLSGDVKGMPQAFIRNLHPKSSEGASIRNVPLIEYAQVNPVLIKGI